MGEMLLNGRLYGASGIRELTQAQYDALPASKLTDGILYCIKDTGIVEGEKFTPVIYSLEEREIGVWTDGKPLYQKTWSFQMPVEVLGNGNWYDTNIEASYIEKVIRADGNRNDTNYVLLIAGLNQSNHIAIMQTRPDRITNLKCFTLQYTKTTDVPGSGSWGTDGVPMVHYDGTEKVIGTWFGETLYEKSFEFTNTIVNTGVATDISSLHIKDVIKLEGVWTRYSGTNAELIYPFGHQESNSHKSYLRVDSEGGYGNNGRLLYVITSDGTNRQKIILQYTKTS